MSEETNVRVCDTDEERFFECGCHVKMINDDSRGEDYPSSPSTLFDFERCGQHSQTVLDAGPIGKFIEDYAKAHPSKEPVAPDEKLVRKLAKKVPVGCGRGNHDYQIVAGKQYARCAKCVSTRTVGATKVQPDGDVNQ